MQAFFQFLADESVHPAVLHGRHGGLGRQVLGQGLRARHGCGGGRRRRGACDLGVDLRRQAAARQLRQVALLLPLHVRRRPARRPGVLQQPEEGRHHVHDPRGGLRVPRPGPGGADVQACSTCRPVRRAASSPVRRRCRRRSARPRWPSSQGAYKLPAGTTAEQVIGHDRARLRRDLHLGHGRHHPDLQVPAALVGHRRQQGGARNTKPRTASRTSTTPASPAIAPAGCAPIGWRTRRRAGQSIAQFRQAYPQYRIVERGARWRDARRRRRHRAAQGRRHRARRPARGPDLQPGPDRPGSAGREGAQHPARPGRDPGHQQGRRRQARSRPSRQRRVRGAGRRSAASSAAANRSRSARTPSSSASTCCTSTGLQERGRQGRRQARQDRASEHVDRPADAVGRHGARAC